MKFKNLVNTKNLEDQYSYKIYEILPEFNKVIKKSRIDLVKKMRKKILILVLFNVIGIFLFFYLNSILYKTIVIGIILISFYIFFSLVIEDSTKNISKSLSKSIKYIMCENVEFDYYGKIHRSEYEINPFNKSANQEYSTLFLVNYKGEIEFESCYLKTKELLKNDYYNPDAKTYKDTIKTTFKGMFYKINLENEFNRNIYITRDKGNLPEYIKLSRQDLKEIIVINNFIVYGSDENEVNKFLQLDLVKNVLLSMKNIKCEIWYYNRHLYIAVNDSKPKISLTNLLCFLNSKKTILNTIAHIDYIKSFLLKVTKRI